MVVFAETKNISAAGVYVSTDSPLELGSELDLLLTVPTELTKSAAASIACKGKVVRVESDLPVGSKGMAVEIYSYDFLARAAGV